jgi:hypothetical protein
VPPRALGGLPSPPARSAAASRRSPRKALFPDCPTIVGRNADAPVRLDQLFFTDRPSMRHHDPSVPYARTGSTADRIACSSRISPSAATVRIATDAVAAETRRVGHRAKSVPQQASDTDRPPCGRWAARLGPRTEPAVELAHGRIEDQVRFAGKRCARVIIQSVLMDAASVQCDPKTRTPPPLRQELRGDVRLTP